MKIWKSFIVIGLAFLLNSCIIKSLQPFYTNESISYNPNFIGEWKDQKNGYWKIADFGDIKEREIKHTDSIKGAKVVSSIKINDINFNEKDNSNKSDKAFINLIKNGYIVEYIKKDKKATFVAIPFKIDNQYFLNFIPFLNTTKINKLLDRHLIPTHSVAKINYTEKGSLNLAWLLEEKIEKLLEEKKLRIKSEKIGITEDLLLTAKSKELYAFLKKYMKSNIEDKWGKSNQYLLSRTNAKP